MRGELSPNQVCFNLIFSKLISHVKYPHDTNFKALFFLLAARGQKTNSSKLKLAKF